MCRICIFRSKIKKPTFIYLYSISYRPYATCQNRRVHYAYTPMLYIYVAIFHCCKNENFLMKKVCVFSPYFCSKHRSWVLVRTASHRSWVHNLCFEQNYEDSQNFSTENCHFYSREKSLYVAWACFRNVCPPHQTIH